MPAQRRKEVLRIINGIAHKQPYAQLFSLSNCVRVRLPRLTQYTYRQLIHGMKRLSSACSLASLLLVVMAFQSNAAEVGDAAPPIKVTDWIKGGPINFESRGTNVVVLDFWATTCAPCRYSIPYLSDLQKRVRSRGVLIVGIASEPVEKVKTYLS